MHDQGHRVELVDDFKARLFAEIIDARDVEQVIERQLVPAEFRNLVQVLPADAKGRLAAKLRPLQKSLAEKFSERFEQFSAGHVRTRASLSAKYSRFCAMNDCSPEIFSCNFISPSSNASGRGGQPET